MISQDTLTMFAFKQRSALVTRVESWPWHDIRLCRDAASREVVAIYNKNFSIPLTVDNFSISASEAPKDASPISWENCAKLGSAKRGMWPNSSWMQSLQEDNRISYRPQEKRKTQYSIVSRKSDYIFQFQEQLLQVMDGGGAIKRSSAI